MRFAGTGRTALSGGSSRRSVRTNRWSLRSSPRCNLPIRSRRFYPGLFQIDRAPETLQPGSRLSASAYTGGAAWFAGIRYSQQPIVVRFVLGRTRPAGTAAFGEGTLMKISHSHRMGLVPALVCLTILALLAQGCTRDPNVRKVKYLNSGKAYAAQG